MILNFQYQRYFLDFVTNALQRKRKKKEKEKISNNFLQRERKKKEEKYL